MLHEQNANVCYGQYIDGMCDNNKDVQAALKALQSAYFIEQANDEVVIQKLLQGRSTIHADYIPGVLRSIGYLIVEQKK